MASDYVIKQNDTFLISAVLKDESDDPVDLTGATVRFKMRKWGASEPVIDAEATIGTPATDGEAAYDGTEEETAEAGLFNGEFEATLASGQVRTFPTSETHPYITIEIVPDLGEAPA